MSDAFTQIIMLGAILCLDLFLYYHLRKALAAVKLAAIIKALFLIVSLLVLILFWNLESVFLKIESYQVRGAIIGFIGLNLILKVVSFVYLVLNFIMEKGTELWNRRVSLKTVKEQSGKSMSRTLFLKKAAVFVASVPLAAKGFGIINRAYDYRVHRIKLPLANLPDSFHGLTIGQISDIHTGSFYDKVAVQGGVDLMMQEKPDIIFFTGDLVNVQTDEVKEYYNIFKQLKAPHGVYSILGNHDYGDYRSWPSAQAKQQNFQDMLIAHRELGWDLLRNENRILTENGESLAIMGVENWGIKRFSKYGDLQKAYQNSEEAAVKILLSHDPSHWEAQVHEFGDIDLTLSGHTHGFQFGVEMGSFSWSPAQYLYKQWAGHYKHKEQHIYVNRGYGFVGMPGRIGINPEITIIELVKA